MHTTPPIHEIIPELTRALEQSEPELMRKLYPRVYPDLGGYYSPKYLATFLASVMIESMYGHISTANKLLIPSTRYMIDRRMPLFFLKPELVEAIKRTDFPDEINWQALPLPYEHGIFMLPNGAMAHPTDGPVACIMWTRFKGPEVTYFALIALCPKNGIWYDSTLTTTKRPVLKLRNLFYVLGEKSGEGPSYPHHLTDSDHDLDPIDKPFIEDLGVILFGTLLAMAARPALLTPGQLQHRVAKKGEQPREFWTPNLVGANYRLPRPEPQGGTHASPRLHWRRGFFRNQAFGAKYAEHKIIWIEPTLVGSGEKHEHEK